MKSGEVILLANGRVWRGVDPDREDAAVKEAMVVGGGRVLAVGTTDDLRARYPHARSIDLAGRTVIPGLIDAHNHAARGGATWGAELHWARLTSREQALDSIRQAAEAAGPRGWVTAIGGWHQTQFSGTWLPSRSELDRAAPDNPVYVQSLYEVGIANTTAVVSVGLAAAVQTLPAGSVETDDGGAPTGVVYGLPAYNLFLAAVGTPDLQQEMVGTRAMVRDYAALGITGVCDPGGFGMSQDRYAALRELARRGELEMRMRLYGSATTPGSEVAQVDDWLDVVASDVGDEWLKMIGIGEVVHFGCHDFEGLDDFAISAPAREQLFEISSAVAARGLPMLIHAVMDDSIDAILDCWERVDRATPIGTLRFSLAHADRITPRNIARAKALGIGIVVDARLAFRSATSQRVWGAAVLRTVPPLCDIVAAGIPLGVGSDATRASSHDPWLSLWWLVAGRPLDGSSQRDEAQRLSRERALAAHTEGSAWFSFEETERGRLEPGWASDLTVLSDDYFSVPVDDILTLHSELTMAGDRISFSSGAVAPATG
jgi:predicted amidohydrolase YtcJ